MKIEKLTEFIALILLAFRGIFVVQLVICFMFIIYNKHLSLKAPKSLPRISVRA